MKNRQPSALERVARVAAAALAGGLIAAPFAAADRFAEPARAERGHAEKVAGTPHFYQGDPRGHFAEEGRNYCCPTAVSDSLVYLAAHGFPRLLPDGEDDPAEAQAELIRTLASDEYMGTNPDNGTDAGEACTGIRRYVEACGYACRTLEYAGWRPLPGSAARFAAGERVSLEQVRRAVADPRGAAWVNIGWYNRGSADGEWERVGGHWVAVVGFGADGSGRDAPDVLLIDNPAVRHAARPPAREKTFARRPSEEAPTREELSADAMTVTEAGRGRLVGKYKGLPRDAAGTYRVSGPGVAMSNTHDAAFLDGAIVLVIEGR